MHAHHARKNSDTPIQARIGTAHAKALDLATTILAALLLASLLALCACSTESSETKIVIDDAVADEAKAYTHITEYGSETVALKEYTADQAAAIYRFTLNGKDYRLPCAAEEFVRYARRWSNLKN